MQIGYEYVKWVCKWTKWRSVFRLEKMRREKEKLNEEKTKQLMTATINYHVLFMKWPFKLAKSSSCTNIYYTGINQWNWNTDKLRQERKKRVYQWFLSLWKLDVFFILMAPNSSTLVEKHKDTHQIGVKQPPNLHTIFIIGVSHWWLPFVFFFSSLFYKLRTKWTKKQEKKICSGLQWITNCLFSRDFIANKSGDFFKNVFNESVSFVNGDTRITRPIVNVYIPLALAILQPKHIWKLWFHLMITMHSPAIMKIDPIFGWVFFCCCCFWVYPIFLHKLLLPTQFHLVEYISFHRFTWLCGYSLKFSIR